MTRTLTDTGSKWSADLIEAKALELSNGDVKAALKLLAHDTSILLATGYFRGVNQSTRIPKPDPPEPIQ